MTVENEYRNSSINNTNNHIRKIENEFTLRFLLIISKIIREKQLKNISFAYMVCNKKLKTTSFYQKLFKFII